MTNLENIKMEKQTPTGLLHTLLLDICMWRWKQDYRGYWQQSPHWQATKYVSKGKVVAGKHSNPVVNPKYYGVLYKLQLGTTSCML